MTIYYRLHTILRHHTPRAYGSIYRYKKVWKYIFSGGMATATNLAVLYVLTDFFGVYYLASSICSFIVSVAVSFTLQKFWTFEDVSRDTLHKQFMVYTIIVSMNLLLNTVLLYVFVEWFSLWYLLAQCISGILIAVISFFAYRSIVFRQ